MRKLIILALLFLTLAASAPAQTKRAPPKQRVITGDIVAAHDGDAATIENQARRETARISPTDAPELDQPYGVESRDELAGLILREQGARKRGRLLWFARAIGGRPAGRLIVDRQSTLR